jgi:hypothetical protein
MLSGVIIKIQKSNCQINPKFEYRNIKQYQNTNSKIKRELLTVFAAYRNWKGKPYHALSVAKGLLVVD